MERTASGRAPSLHPGGRFPGGRDEGLIRVRGRGEGCRPVSRRRSDQWLSRAGVFLELNGFRLEAPEADAVTTMLALSSGGLDEKGFTDWLRGASKEMR